MTLWQCGVCNMIDVRAGHQHMDLPTMIATKQPLFSTLMAVIR